MVTNSLRTERLACSVALFDCYSTDIIDLFATRHYRLVCYLCCAYVSTIMCDPFDIGIIIVIHSILEPLLEIIVEIIGV